MAGTRELDLMASGENAIVINAPKEGEFYILSVDTSTPQHDVVFENEDTVAMPPYQLPLPEGAGFPPFNEIPRLRQSRLDRSVSDLDSSFGGYWLVSEPLKRVFESVDPDGFAFAPCEFILADGSQGPPHYLCDVVRTLDAVDEVASKVKIRRGDNFRNGKAYSLTGGARLAFKKDVVGQAHIFDTPYSSGLVVCDRVLRDALIEHGFGKEPKTRGVLLEDAAANGIYAMAAEYWPENQ